ncbi:hypothetical protein N0V88_000034 [Collariella sp. IMI 366227]|nr:hypothetical protein N0V88_000034 [Collariella sp. IMI 366227]
MPTIALLPGHAFAGGIMLAMHHDYRVMNPSRGFACVNELEFGLVLEAHRFGGQAAVDAGIADRLGGLDAVLELVKEKKLTNKAKTGIYGLLKAEMYRESVKECSLEGMRPGRRGIWSWQRGGSEEGGGEKRVGELKAKAKL